MCLRTSRPTIGEGGELPLVQTSLHRARIALHAIIIALMCLAVPVVAAAQISCTDSRMSVPAATASSDLRVDRNAPSIFAQACDALISSPECGERQSQNAEGSCDCICSPTSFLASVCRADGKAPRSSCLALASSSPHEEVNLEIEIPPIILV